jgi:hypothetical protein
MIAPMPNSATLIGPSVRFNGAPFFAQLPEFHRGFLVRKIPRSKLVVSFSRIQFRNVVVAAEFATEGAKGKGQRSKRKRLKVKAIYFDRVSLVFALCP